jgi:hypothetical protein
MIIARLQAHLPVSARERGKFRLSPVLAGIRPAFLDLPPRCFGMVPFFAIDRQGAANATYTD